MRLTWLGGLPEREVERVAFALVHVNAGTALQVVDIATGKLAVLGEGTHREVHVAIDLVGMATIDEALHELDHLGNLLRGTRAHVRIVDAEGVHVIDEGLGIERRDLLGRLALLLRAPDDLVIDIGDVLDEGDLVTAILQVLAHHVEDEEGARVADVNVVVDRGATCVHRHLARLVRHELLFAAGRGVVDLHGHSSVQSCVRPNILTVMAPGAFRKAAFVPKLRNGKTTAELACKNRTLRQSSQDRFVVSCFTHEPFGMRQALQVIKASVAQRERTPQLTFCYWCESRQMAWADAPSPLPS